MMGKDEHVQYYMLMMDESDPLALCWVKTDYRGIDKERFHRGAWIAEWPEGVTIYVEGQHREDYLLAGLPWYIFSERVRQVFERCGVEGVQFLPVTMKHTETGEVFGQYWALNVMREVEALDWDRTHWVRPATRDTDPYPELNIWKPALLQEPLSGIDIFRLIVKGRKRSGIYVSGRLKRCLEQAGATSGIKFGPIPVY